MCEISVIIPVFNGEKYLNECLDSVVNQSFKDIEIICVNDGSTDASLKILKQYSNKDKRIKIISQENKGLGASRNIGLKKSCGKYIYFIDCDDYIDLKTLEKLYNNITSNDSDVVLFKYNTFKDNKVCKKNVQFKINQIFGDTDYSNFTFTYCDVKKHVLNSAYSACLKLYKRELLDFYFTEGVLFEDILFHVKVMLKASKISFLNESLYYYRFNTDSIINTAHNAFDILGVIGDVEAFLIDNNYYEEFKNEFIKFKIAQSILYIPSGGDEYFNLVKCELMKIDINNNAKSLVLESKNYSDYMLKYYENELSKLKNKNKQLMKERDELKEFLDEMLSSRIWKLTKIFRKLS